MAHRKKIEIYSAGCRVCRQAEVMVRRIAGANHDVEVRLMHRVHVANRASELGIRSVPAVVVDGQLAACCVDRGVDEEVLRSALA
jgi:glutaredoxin 3